MGTFFKRLSTRLYLVVSLCFTLATLLVMVVSAQIQERTLLQEAERNLEQVSEVFQASLDVILNTRRQALLNLADNLQRWSTNDHPSLADEAALRQLFDHLWVVDRRGNVVDEWPRLGALREQLNISERSMFQRVRDGETFVLTEPQVSYYNNEHVVYAVVPVFDTDDSFLAAVVGIFSLRNNEVLNRVVTTRIGKSGYVAIADENGYIVGHPDRKLLGMRLTEQDSPQLFKSINTQWQGVGIAPGIHDASMLQAIKPLNTGYWFVGAQLDLREAMQPVRLLRNVQWLLGFFALVIALFMLSLILHSYLKPLSKLQDEVEAIQNKRRQTLTEPGIQELRQLVFKFNSLLATNATNEAALQQRQAYLHQILETSSVGLFMADSKGRIEYVNHRMVEMTGYAASDLISHGFVKQLNEPDRIRYIETVREALHDQVPVKIEVQLYHSDGNLVWLSIETSPVSVHGQCLGHVGTVTDITQQRIAIAELKNAALHDTLTGLLNRRGIEKGMSDSFNACIASKEPFVLLMIDLDNFKQLNDANGHAYGDRVLVNVAKLMRSITRDTDKLGRLGGDEFVIALPACPERRAEQMAEALIRSATRLTPDNKTSIALSFSIGISSRKDTDLTYQSVLERADKAAYEVKRAGGGHWVSSDHKAPG